MKTYLVRLTLPITIGQHGQDPQEWAFEEIADHITRDNGLNAFVDSELIHDTLAIHKAEGATEGGAE